jgi:hypothetical protein
MNIEVRKIIREELGVPENLYETASKLHTNLVNKFNELTMGDLDDDNEFTFTLSGRYHISDYYFNNINVTTKIIESDRTDKIIISSMGMGSQFVLGKSLNFERVIMNTPKFKIDLIVPEDWNVSDIAEYFKINKKKILETLGHELKHAYDSFKTPTEKPTERAKYSTYTKIGFGVPPITNFLHDLYYTHIAENLVRPSEVAIAIKANKINQKEFINFLSSNEVYQNMKRISSFSFDELKEDLKNYIDDIDDLIEHAGITSPDTDEEKIDFILEFIYENIQRFKSEIYKGILTTSFMEQIMGFGGDKQKAFDKFIRSLEKFENYEDFYRSEEKQFKYVGNNMLKKIGKLYAMTGKGKVKKKS